MLLQTRAVPKHQSFWESGLVLDGAFVVVVVVQGFSPRLPLAILLVHVYAYIQQQNGEEDRTKRMPLPNLLQSEP